MPHYFFHVRNQQDYTRDTVGADLPDLAHARQQASRSAGEILTSELGDGSNGVAFEIQIEDGADERLFTMRIQGIVDSAKPASPD